MLLNADNRSYAVGFALRMPLFATPRRGAQGDGTRGRSAQVEHGLKAATDNGRLEVSQRVHRLAGRAARSSRRSRRRWSCAREGLSIARCRTRTASSPRPS